jgi:hypothetical protein
MGAHTPGPWAVGSLVELGYIPVTATNRTGRKVTVAAVHLQAGPKEEESNAALIAAAPDLAAACEEAAMRIHGGEAHVRPFSECRDGVCKAAFLALQKAGLR